MLARRGGFEEAERLARSAVGLGERIDFINDRADAWLDLAEVLRLAGKSDEAADAVRQALEFYGQKGNVPSAGRARALLEEISG
ncbi:MAG: tetratricopeptide repeat protein [Actinobacteria bacterium]|nr:tetratricopeptide repeat protein [Actinomycetota bacterium]